jgi:glycosyltransferase involved in cell wall biosynthesis
MSLLFYKKRKFKIILWGIGIRASYTHGFGEKTMWDKLRFYLMRKADALVFYSNYPIDIYKEQKFPKNKLFVANNTVLVNSYANNNVRDSIIFIGTLYKQKKIYELLESYNEAFKKNGTIPRLEIIGHGDEYENIHEWISTNKLSEHVFLRGKIYDEPILASYFCKAIACISPGQAGLSVLKSMGYAVPFITKKNAITGGEIFNIESGMSGILYEKDSELVDIILDIALSPSKYIDMGISAKKHYDKCRKPIDMANEISQSIEYVCNH